MLSMEDQPHNPGVMTKTWMFNQLSHPGTSIINLITKLFHWTVPSRLTLWNRLKFPIVELLSMLTDYITLFSLFPFSNLYHFLFLLICSVSFSVSIHYQFSMNSLVEVLLLLREFAFKSRSLEAERSKGMVF